LKRALSYRRPAPLLAAGASLMVLLTATAAQAQGPGWYGPAYAQPGCSPTYVPGCPAPYLVQPQQTNPQQTNPQTTTQAPEPETENPGMGAPGGETVALSPGGYLDDAIPQTLFRLRYESRFDINRFDRASYMYATWQEGAFHTHALVGGNGTIRGTFFDLKATGPQIGSDDIDDQTLSAYTEFAFSQRASVFVDVPFRFVHFGDSLEDEGGEDGPNSPDHRQFPETEVPDPKSTTGGLSDIDVGFKYALIAETNNRYVTFQFRTYLPTGDPGLGLGTGHVSLEPSLLFYQRLTDRLVAQAQLTDWIPIAAGPGAGNVTEYGAGLGYDVIQTCKLRVTPVFEMVGWTVLGGTESFTGTVPGTVTPAGLGGTAPLVPAINVNGTFVPDDHGFLEANGDTIVNLKFGVRTYFGDRSDLYAGYGHTVTGSRWYNDIFRVEYRIHF